MIAYMRLEGPFQSYGTNGVWYDRTTQLAPTKSAVVGMFGAMLGLPYGSEQLGELSNGLSFSVRINRKGSLLTDFQTMCARVSDVNFADGVLFAKVTSNKYADAGFNIKAYSDEYLKEHPHVKGETKIRHKTYLQDASFTVFVEGEDKLIEKLCNASMNPVFSVFLGRKCCFPSFPIILKKSQYDDVEEAWKNDDLEYLTRLDNKCCMVKCEWEVKKENQFGLREEVADVPLGNYKYAYRNVFTTEVTVNVSDEIQI